MAMACISKCIDKNAIYKITFTIRYVNIYSILYVGKLTIYSPASGLDDIYVDYAQS